MIQTILQVQKECCEMLICKISCDHPKDGETNPASSAMGNFPWEFVLFRFLDSDIIHYCTIIFFDVGKTIIQ